MDVIVAHVEIEHAIPVLVETICSGFPRFACVKISNLCYINPHITLEWQAL
jgi:hypothetical protein